MYEPVTAIFSTALSLGTLDFPGSANCARVARSVEELEDDSDGIGVVHPGPAARGLTMMVEEVRSRIWRSLQKANM